MNESRANESRAGQFGKHVLAGLVLLIAALIVLKLLISIVAAVFVPIIAILAVVALIWAARVLL
ncbi:MAG: hypothetical protein FWD42_08840 [Solirubrobacterales bacterium]|nr:hypothetical protein [Solirubrobacterales bacterium]